MQGKARDSLMRPGLIRAGDPAERLSKKRAPLLES